MNINNIIIKESDEQTKSLVLEVEKLAFQSNEEAELVNNLLQDESAKPYVSLLAMDGHQAVGHILFTKAIIENATPECLVYILAPLAVIPQYQGKGIGGLLIREGLLQLQNMGVEHVFVLGHPTYYPRHGFLADAKKYGYPAPFPIPEKDKDAWMMQTLLKKDSKVTGRILCADSMSRPEYWRE